MNANVFNWSRIPSRDGISSVVIASKSDYSSYKHISRAELSHSLYTYNRIEDLRRKQHMLRSVVMGIAISIPFIAILINIFKGMS